MTQLRELCDQARRELGALGELGRGLVGALDAVEAASAGRGAEVLAEPAFALEVLMVAGEGTGAATVGRVLDFLRQRAGAPAIPSIVRVTVAQAIEAYERGGLALMATGTGHTYRTWTRRLVAALGAADVAAVTAGDLTDVIAAHATPGNGRRGRGRSAEENAVAAFRHLWGYLVEKGYAQANVAARLRKPSRGEPARRAIRPEEAALFRQLVRAGRDPLLDEVTLSLAERLGLRRIEICRLRLCDVDFARREAMVWGKGDKDRVVPIPPQLAELLERYMEDRRPDGVAAAACGGARTRSCADDPCRRARRAHPPGGVESRSSSLGSAAPPPTCSSAVACRCTPTATRWPPSSTPGGGGRSPAPSWVTPRGVRPPITTSTSTGARSSRCLPRTRPTCLARRRPRCSRRGPVEHRDPVGRDRR